MVDFRETGIAYIFNCLIAFAKVIPKLVKNVLNRDDMDFVFLFSTPSFIIELGAEDFMLRDVNSIQSFP